eukprot:5351047-Pyramimonas_sp.AAC.1
MEEGCSSHSRAMYVRMKDRAMIRRVWQILKPIPSMRSGSRAYAFCSHISWNLTCAEELRPGTSRPDNYIIFQQGLDGYDEEYLVP